MSFVPDIVISKNQKNDLVPQRYKSLRFLFNAVKYRCGIFGHLRTTLRAREHPAYTLGLIRCGVCSGYLLYSRGLLIYLLES